VDQQPEYPGGYEKMMEYLRANVRYPKQAADNKVEGVVFVQFVVDETGKILDPGVIRGVEKSLDDEAIRVVQAMPNWIPGKEEGVNVKVRFVLPLKFNAGFGKKDESVGANLFKLDGNLQTTSLDGKTILTGKIVDRDGNPAEGVLVVVPGGVYKTKTGADGKFSLETATEKGQIVCVKEGFGRQLFSY
jgi:TonB family protein